jgi:glycosyltransferase involved in cell wall biosynthesis
MQDGPAALGAPVAPLRAPAPRPGALIATTEPRVELTVVVPTFEERENIAPLIARLVAALDGIAWEVVFVDDDSPDGTAAAATPRVGAPQSGTGRRGTTARAASSPGAPRAAERGRLPGKRYGLRASGAHLPGVRALDCRPWHSARPCSKRSSYPHHTAPRPSGKRQAGSGG